MAQEWEGQRKLHVEQERLLARGFYIPMLRWSPGDSFVEEGGGECNPDSHQEQPQPQPRRRVLEEFVRDNRRCNRHGDATHGGAGNMPSRGGAYQRLALRVGCLIQLSLLLVPLVGDFPLAREPASDSLPQAWWWCGARLDRSILPSAICMRTTWVSVGDGRELHVVCATVCLTAGSRTPPSPSFCSLPQGT